MQNIKKIRNAFAHYAEHNSFGSMKMGDLCRNFELVDSHVKAARSTMALSDGTASTSIDSVSVIGNVISLNLDDHKTALTTPKGRFISTAKLICAAMFIYRQAANAPGGPDLKKPII